MIRAVVVSLDGDVLDLLDGRDDINVIGFLDADLKARDQYYRNLGNDHCWEQLISEDPSLKVILAVDPPHIRAKLATYYGLENLISLQCRSASVSRTVKIGHGTIIQRGAAVGRNSRIGIACKLNCDAQLHHDNELGDFSVVAPGARLLGNVTVRSGTYIGAGAIVLPRVTIGRGVTIGAGALVTRDVPDAVTAVGIPARW
jgi:sugar O-acyltransferase (sialic acid O-acetyltransferase NeuD family)